MRVVVAVIVVLVAAAGAKEAKGKAKRARPGAMRARFQRSFSFFLLPSAPARPWAFVDGTDARGMRDRPRASLARPTPLKKRLRPAQRTAAPGARHSCRCLVLLARPPHPPVRQPLHSLKRFRLGSLRCPGAALLAGRARLGMDGASVVVVPPKPPPARGHKFPSSSCFA